MTSIKDIVICRLKTARQQAWDEIYGNCVKSSGSAELIEKIQKRIERIDALILKLVGESNGSKRNSCSK